jgi:hypothetical protein
MRKEINGLCDYFLALVLPALISLTKASDLFGSVNTAML